MKVYIDNGSGPVDYTQYVVEDTLVIEDSINVPIVVSMSLVASDSTFVVPKRSSYVYVVSTIFAASGGYLTPGLDPIKYGKIMATGFITNEPARDYLGLNQHVGFKYGFQQLTYSLSITSDEWFLNTKIVPFIPAFVNQTQGQILSSLAQALRPGVFDTTSFVASGDLVPYFEYDPNTTWSDLAKQFADSIRYRIRIINKVMYFVPFGDGALGVKYDEVTQKQSQFVPLDLKTEVLTVPPVNDALVLGQVEPQNQWDNYFIGDGFTSNFDLPYASFRGSSVTLQSDDWTEQSFDTNQWNVQDPLGTIVLAGALNMNQVGNPSPHLGITYIVGQNGVELGGAINVQAGEVEFVDTNTGIVGGVYTSSDLQASSCFAGFNVTTPGTPVLTASGAGGIVIQPMLNGVPVGPTVTTQPNHHYQLQIWMGGNRFDRYNSIYKNLTGLTQYGGNALAGFGQLTWVIGDIDIGIVVANQYGPQSIGPPVPVVPQLTKYSLNGVSFPSFGIFAPVNGVNLNLAMNYTLLAQPPQGTLIVRSLTGASGGLQPILPQNIGLPLQYLVGQGFENQTATVSQNGETSQLQFYNDTIPAVGARIRFESWQAGTAIARVRNTVAIANEKTISGDDGTRSAIFTNLQPSPRTSDECELAAAAVIQDQAFPQFQGSYQVFSVPFYYNQLFDPRLTDYPRSGRYFYVNSPVRGITGQNFFTSTVRMQVVEMREEILQVSVEYGPDLYLEKLLTNFVERTTNLLTPQETTETPTPIQLENAGQFWLPPFTNARVTNIVNTISGSFITIDLGSPPLSAAEVRRVDAGWGTTDSNFVGRFTTQQFTILRTAHDQHWFVRPISGAQTSRFSYVPRINYPLIPGQPFPRALDVTNGLAPVVTFDYPQQGVEPGIGLFMTVPQYLAPSGFVVSFSRFNNQAFLLMDNRAVPQPNGFNQYVNSKVIIDGVPDPSFNGTYTITPAGVGYNFFHYDNPGPNTGTIVTSTGNPVKVEVPVTINTTVGYSEIQNPFVSDVYGMEIRGPDNKTVILQRVITAPSDLIVTLTAVSGLLVSGALSATGGFLITIYPYFYNLMWDYSLPYALTFDPNLSGCCADCIDPVDYGAMGDGIQDDTRYVQTALSVAGYNAGNTSLFFGSVPATLNGVFNKGTRVCIKSSRKFVVTPQLLDGINQGVCLQVDSGVNIQLDGSLVLQAPASSSPLFTQPWVVLENRNAFAGGDSGIVIQGAGSIDGNSPNIVNSAAVVQQLPVSNVQSSAVKVCGGYGYVVDTAAQQIVRINMATGQVVAQSQNLSLYANSGGGVAALSQIECDAVNGYVYVGLGGGQNLGIVVSLEPTSLRIATSQGNSGTCQALLVVPRFCANCQGSNPPCFGNPGDIVSVPLTGPNGVISYTVSIDRINVPGFTDVAVMANTKKLGLVITQQQVQACIACICGQPFLLGPSYNTGAYNYAGGSLSNPTYPTGSWDKSGWVYVLNGASAGGPLWLSSAHITDGNQNGCTGCAQFFHDVFGSCNIITENVTVPGYQTVTFNDLHTAIPTGNPFMGYCQPDNTQILTTSATKTVYKMTSLSTGLAFPTQTDLTSFNPIFDRISFKTIDPATGLMAIRCQDSFILFNTVTMSVQSVFSNISAQSGGQIPSGAGGSTAYDPTTNTVLFVTGGKAYRVGLGHGLLNGTYGCIQFDSVTSSRVEGIQLKQFTSYGLSAYRSNGLIMNELVNPAPYRQTGQFVLLNKCKGSVVRGCTLDGLNSTGLVFVSDYASIGTVVDGNTTIRLPGKSVYRQNVGYDDGITYATYGGIVVTNNTFVSGTIANDVVVSLFASGVFQDIGAVVSNNVITSNRQNGLSVGNYADVAISNNVIEFNSYGLQKAPGSTLTNVAIINNVVNNNIGGDIAPYTLATSPVFADGVSTVTMFNPATDTTLYKSWLSQQPIVEGSTVGQGGYAYPPAPPNSLYSIQAVGSPTTPVLTQNGLASTILIAPFQIEWTDLTLTYEGPVDQFGNAIALTPNPNHGYSTYHVFVDDPYRDGVTNLYWGTTQNLQDLTTSAGRYYIGTITLTPQGGNSGQGGGMVPPGTQIPTQINTQPYDVSCTFDGLVPANFKTTIFPFTRSVTFPANFQGSQGWVEFVTLAPAGVTFVVNKIAGGQGTAVQVGSILWASGVHAATFSTIGAAIVAFGSTDIMTIVAPGSTDQNFQNLGYTLSGIRATSPVLANLQLILGDSLNFWQDAVRNNYPTQSEILSDQMTLRDGPVAVSLVGSQFRIVIQ